jgi:hypothetical protein
MTMTVTAMMMVITHRLKQPMVIVYLIALLEVGSCRKPEMSDPLHKWVGTYNL